MNHLPQTIRFATFNCGAGFNDYNFMLNANKEEKDKFNAVYKQEVTVREEDLPFREKTMQKIETVVADRLANELDVICLQETKDLKRPFCTRLEERGFTLYRLEPSNGEAVCPENVVAIRNSTIPGATVENISIPSQSRPDPVRNPEKSGCGQQIAGVIVRVNDLYNLAFVSLHSWGFKLFSPTQWEQNNPVNSDDWINNQRDREAAYQYMNEALSLVKNHNPSFAVIAGDLNNNTINYKEPFKLYEKNGFATHEPDQPTNVNYSEEQYPQRKIDYIFTSKPSLLRRCINKIKSIFCSTQSFQVTPPRVSSGFDFTMESNCSDHKPFGTTITIDHTPSGFSRLYNFFARCFCRQEPAPAAT